MSARRTYRALLLLRRAESARIAATSIFAIVAIILATTTLAVTVTLGDDPLWTGTLGYGLALVLAATAVALLVLARRLERRAMDWSHLNHR